MSAGRFASISSIRVRPQAITALSRVGAPMPMTRVTSPRLRRGAGRVGLKAIKACAWLAGAYDKHTLGDLVERLEALGPDHRKRVWELIAAWNDAGLADNQRAVLRERIRRCALTRRGRHLRLDEVEREYARQAYALLEPPGRCNASSMALPKSSG